MIDSLALLVLSAAGLYGLVFGATALLGPEQAARFLLGFAGTPLRHYTELAIRAAVGFAAVVAAPLLSASAAFVAFGWVLLVSTAGLLLVPWHWHRRMAQRTVPLAARHLRPIGLAALLGGALILDAVVPRLAV